MTVQKPGLQDAIAEALTESKYPVDETLESQLASYDALAEDEGELTDDTAQAQSGEEPSTAESSEDSVDAPEADEAQADVPDSYWGVDLTGIPPEKRAEVIAHFEQQDSTIRKLQERLSTPKEQEAPAVEEDAPPTDEELLRVAGIDPEDFSVPEALKASTVALMRNQLALEDQVARLTTMETGRAVEGQWNKDLDELESTYGKLPGTRAEVLRFAFEEQIPTPADLYFRLTAPVKREVETLAAAARRDAEKRVQSAGVKPRNVATGSAPIKPGMSMRDAVKAAALEAQKDTGLSWKQAVKRVLTAKPEA